MSNKGMVMGWWKLLFLQGFQVPLFLMAFEKLRGKIIDGCSFRQPKILRKLSHIVDSFYVIIKNTIQLL